MIFIAVGLMIPYIAVISYVVLNAFKRADRDLTALDRIILRQKDELS